MREASQIRKIAIPPSILKSAVKSPSSGSLVLEKKYHHDEKVISIYSNNRYTYTVNTKLKFSNWVLGN